MPLFVKPLFIYSYFSLEFFRSSFIQLNVNFITENAELHRGTNKFIGFSGWAGFILNFQSRKIL